MTTAVVGAPGSPRRYLHSLWLLSARDLYAFDNVVTAPLHGYRDADDYWNRASARHVLGDITVPTRRLTCSG